ncbi:WGR domain-containing protein, partial [bacterium]|nr:WGR domain-containing protein [bacterium]
MKLVRQTKLAFQEGASDKVYEVDLCEASEGEFIVNFRYGRRGASLREGTKTPFPESLVKAENIFAALVAEKTKKGYLINGESGGPAEIPKVAEVPSAVDNPRVTATIARIGRGFGEEGWRLSRAVWRAGQWQITAAVPALRSLASEATGMDAWCLAFALGRCGTEAELDVLELLTNNNSADATFLRIAREAKLALLPAPDKVTFLEEVAAQLPPVVRDSLDAPHLGEVIQSLIESGQSPLSLSADLYLIARSRPHIREVLYSLSKSIPPSKNGILLLRQLFKAAEFRRDAEVYGVLVRRFETSPSLGRSGYSWHLRKVFRRPFSSGTKKYFQRRVMRTLREAGDDGDAATFIPFATGILLAYDDSLDKPYPGSQWGYSYNAQTRRHTSRQIHLPARASSPSFMWILRGKSTTLTHERGFKWAFVDLVTTATTREEVYPELWNQAPDAITHLLTQARAADVQDFALRVWKDHPAWAKAIEIPP